MNIGVIGAGTMGAGIAQIAAQNKNEIVLIDNNENQLEIAKINIEKSLSKLTEKGKISEQEKVDIADRVTRSIEFSDLKDCDLVIEAIIEDINVKHSVFAAIEKNVSRNCIIASNTSSLSIASIGRVLEFPQRMIGIHFFNPATIMPLVEIIPGIQTEERIVDDAKRIISSWKKTVVLCKDTPGFIVNRVARPFYGEALRIYDEGIADFATIDWAMTELAQFKMGPFTLMDYIGNDVNYAVTESVFNAFYYDPRFKPSFTQKRLSEAGLLGRKTGKGYYDYSPEAVRCEPQKDLKLGNQIVERILCMLINEAYDALMMKIASKEDIELAMTKGVNYPKGLFEWAEEIGLNRVLKVLNNLFEDYGEDRYRPNALLKKMSMK